MKLLINDKEITNYLSSLIDVRDAIKSVELKNRNLEPVVEWILEKKSREGGLNIVKFKLKFKEKLYSAIRKDLEAYVREVKEVVILYRKTYYTNIHKNTDYFLKKLDEQKVINFYKESNTSGFIKSVGLHLDSTAELIRRKNFNNVQEDCLLRNTVGNEHFLISKIDNKLPFWFIDSGYTNFLESNKKWHRLVRNHLHFGTQFDAPVDRLGIFKTFPKQWRTGGDKILVIEPGQFAANIFHVDIKQWKYQVESELRKYTDKKIVFREKAPKKQRTPLYKHLLDDDYYAVVSINSNAATESIWAGIPVITLDRHITNSVARSSLADINNLYRGSLAEWLAMLSYSQFTYEELIDGTAATLVKKYHA
jgi:hypothetical protein